MIKIILLIVLKIIINENYIFITCNLKFATASAGANAIRNVNKITAKVWTGLYI